MKRIADVIDKAARGELDMAAFLSSPGYTEDDKVMVYAACYAAKRYVEESHKGVRRSGRLSRGRLRATKEALLRD